MKKIFKVFFFTFEACSSFQQNTFVLYLLIQILLASISFLGRRVFQPSTPLFVRLLPDPQAVENTG